MTEDARAAASLNVSRETLERLDIYAHLLERWNQRINLVSKKTLPDLWMRHILDSLQILDLAPADQREWTDLGSGGGFPGAVVAIVAAERSPELKMTLIEADARKSAFLRTVSRDTDVQMRIVTDRIETAPPQGAETVSARALAPLSKLLEFAHRHLKREGGALFLKGASADKEIAEALEKWSFDWESHPSQTDPNGVVLSIGAIQRA